MSLADLGWTGAIGALFEPWRGNGLVEPGRVVIEFNHLYRVALEEGDIEAVLAGRMKHRASSRSELPAVGDWVAVRRDADRRRGAIVAVLPRRSRFSRKAAGNVPDGEVSEDGEFSVEEVECLGACVNAPVLWVGDDFYEDLDGPSTEALLEALKRGEHPTPGSAIGRMGAAPEGGPNTLTEPPTPPEKAPAE